MIHTHPTMTQRVQVEIFKRCFEATLLWSGDVDIAKTKARQKVLRVL